MIKKIPKILIKHNHRRIDNYYWLNQRENPEVIDYLNSENQYLDDKLLPLNGFKEKIYSEIVNKVDPHEVSAPYFNNGYYYYSRFEANDEFPRYYRKKEKLHSKEEVLLNVNELAEDHDFYKLTELKISPDNKYLAYGEDTLSRRIFTIYFKDLATGKMLQESIPNTEGDIEWSNDSKNIYYIIKDNTLRPHKVCRHTLFTAVEQDQEVYHENDKTFNVSIYKDISGKYIQILSDNTLTTEIRLINADDANQNPRLFSKREKDIIYYVVHTTEGFYILTNLDALNFKVMKCPEKNTSKKYWQEYIGHREDVYLVDIDAFKNFLVLTERTNGLRKLRIIKESGQSEFCIDFSEQAYVIYLSDNYVFDSAVFRYTYESLATPLTIYDYNVFSGEQKVVKQNIVPGDYDPSLYKIERFMAPARDGKSVPVSIIYRKDKKKTNAENPLLLYGYGSYGFSMEAWFNRAISSLLDRGIIYAIAHIRGGAEMGRHWYEDGKLLHKKNTFNDFIDVGEYLIDKGFSTHDQLCIYGRSAGGLLIGAVLNMYPSFCKAAVAAVPFVDVVTTMLDETIPLTTVEYDEWGNPNIKKYYDYMLSYSPYDNVEAKDYPALLVTAGFHDSQVQYWEPAKWVAKLRQLKTDQNALYLHTKMEAGHAGASGRYEYYIEIALIYTFILNELGITE